MSIFTILAIVAALGAVFFYFVDRDRKKRAAVDAPPVVVDITPVEPQPAPAPAPDPVPAPAPPVPPAISWTPVLFEDWNTLKLSGWIRQEYTSCGMNKDDPGSGPLNKVGVADDEWAASEQLRVLDETENAPGLLRIRSKQHATGWSLLSGKDLDPTKPLRLSATVNLEPTEGAWVGLALHNGEGNYREIGITIVNGVPTLIKHAPCYVEHIGRAPRGPVLLVLMWDPQHGWAFIASGDGETISHGEPLGYRNNILRGTPRAGLWAVNLEVESRKLSEGFVNAEVGMLLVHQGDL